MRGAVLNVEDLERQKQGKGSAAITTTTPAAPGTVHSGKLAAVRGCLGGRAPATQGNRAVAASRDQCRSCGPHRGRSLAVNLLVDTTGS